MPLGRLLDRCLDSFALLSAAIARPCAQRGAPCIPTAPASAPAQKRPDCGAHRSLDGLCVQYAVRLHGGRDAVLCLAGQGNAGLRHPALCPGPGHNR